MQPFHLEINHIAAFQWAGACQVGNEGDDGHEAKKGGKLLAKGLNASPGAATGVAVFDADTARLWAEAGREVILVSSGAVAAGRQHLGTGHKLSPGLKVKQALAAMGQSLLMQAYEQAFGRLRQKVAQVLLTHADLSSRDRYLNVRNTILTLFDFGVIPIINENDTVTTDEIRVGDNDTLGALVTNLIEADVLVLLTDQQGLYTADPRRDPAAKLVRQAKAGDPALEAMAGGAGSAIGRGGMLTKVLAAKRAARSGAATVIASGREPDVLTRLAGGEAIGTELVAETQTLAARKQWLADHVQLAGRLTLDAGAVRALAREGKSLLPIGVVAVEGAFQRGEVVGCYDPEGREVARGLVNYDAAETARIMRRPSSETSICTPNGTACTPGT